MQTYYIQIKSYLLHLEKITRKYLEHIKQISIKLVTKQSCNYTDVHLLIK